MGTKTDHDYDMAMTQGQYSEDEDLDLALDLPKDGAEEAQEAPRETYRGTGIQRGRGRPGNPTGPYRVVLSISQQERRWLRKMAWKYDLRSPAAVLKLLMNQARGLIAIKPQHGPAPWNRHDPTHLKLESPPVVAEPAGATEPGPTGNATDE